MKRLGSFRIELPTIVTPSGNATRQWDRSREFWKFKEEKALYRGVLYLAGAREEEYHCEPGSRRSVNFQSYRARLIDDDNLAWGFKMLRDILVEFKIIHDDSPEFLEASYHQEVDRENLGTILIIRDLCPEGRNE